MMVCSVVQINVLPTKYYIWMDLVSIVQSSKKHQKMGLTASKLLVYKKLPCKRMEVANLKVKRKKCKRIAHLVPLKDLSKTARVDLSFVNSVHPLQDPYSMIIVSNQSVEIKMSMFMNKVIVRSAPNSIMLQRTTNLVFINVIKTKL